jgi:hypothetical protein
MGKNTRHVGLDGVRPPSRFNSTRTRPSQEERGRDSRHISENSLQDTTLAPVGVQRLVRQWSVFSNS